MQKSRKIPNLELRQNSRGKFMLRLPFRNLSSDGKSTSEHPKALLEIFPIELLSINPKTLILEINRGERFQRKERLVSGENTKTLKISKQQTNLLGRGERGEARDSPLLPPPKVISFVTTVGFLQFE